MLKLILAAKKRKGRAPCDEIAWYCRAQHHCESQRAEVGTSHCWTTEFLLQVVVGQGSYGNQPGKGNKG